MDGLTDPTQTTTTTDENDGGPHWSDSLPETQRGEYAGKDLAEVLTRYKGEVDSRLKVPGEGATAEERTAFETQIRKVLGVPDTVDGYQLTLPEGVTKEDPLLSAFVQAGHAKGMTQAQVQTAVDTFTTTMQGMMDAEAQAGKQALQTLWGAQFDANLGASITAWTAAASEAGVSKEEFDAFMNSTGMGNKPVLVRIGHALSRFYKEDTLKGEGAGKTVSTEEKFFPGGIQ